MYKLISNFIIHLLIQLSNLKNSDLFFTPEVLVEDHSVLPIVGEKYCHRNPNTKGERTNRHDKFHHRDIFSADLKSKSDLFQI